MDFERVEAETREQNVRNREHNVDGWSEDEGETEGFYKGGFERWRETEESRMSGNSRLKRWRAAGSRWLISEDEGETEGFYKGNGDRGEQNERQFKIETLEGNRG